MSKLETGLAKNIYVTPAIFQHFFPKIEDGVLFGFEPGAAFFPFFGFHNVATLIGRIGVGSDIMLVISGVEEMG